MSSKRCYQLALIALLFNLAIFYIFLFNTFVKPSSRDISNQVQQLSEKAETKLPILQPLDLFGLATNEADGALSASSPSASNRHPVGLIVLKLPRTGSTWFTEQINSLSNVFVSKEIVQHSDRDKLDILSLESHLFKALRSPQPKYSAAKHWFPFLEYRFVTDYLFHRELKLLRHMHYVGFTLNPEHTNNVNWGRIVGRRNNTDDIKVVLYLRSNVVKTAISSYRGKMSSQLCGNANSRQKDKCELPKSINWTMEEFKREVNTWTLRKDAFIRSYSDDPVLSALPSAVVYYEQLQSDIQSVLKMLFKTPHFISQNSLRMASSSWKKRTTDDLSTVMTQFSAIHKILMHDKNCKCLADQLTSSTPEIFIDGASRICRIILTDQYSCIPLSSQTKSIW